MNEDKAMKAYKALRDMESETDLKKGKIHLIRLPRGLRMST